MAQYVALIDGEPGAYGVSFPDAPGCTAMAATVEEAYRSGVAVLGAWMEDRIADGLEEPAPRTLDAILRDPAEALDGPHVAVLVPLLRDTGRSVRANISLDAGLLAAVDEAARERGLTRSGFLASAARDKIAERR